MLYFLNLLQAEPPRRPGIGRAKTKPDGDPSGSACHSMRGAGPRVGVPVWSEIADHAGEFRL